MIEGIADIWERTERSPASFKAYLQNLAIHEAYYGEGESVFDIAMEHRISEIPKYYAQNSHPAIVSAQVFDLTQMELEWRRSLKGSYSGKSCFASRIVCGDCGTFYGSKVWHSTDAYRRVIWQCNSKYEGDKKCSTPHVIQEELERAFVSVMQRILQEKAEILTACRAVLEVALNTAELDRAAKRLEEQALGIAERVRKLVDENARVQMNQEEYQQKYNSLAKDYEKTSEKLRWIANQKQDKADRRRKIEIFLRMLEQQEECLDFDPYTFVALVDKVVVGKDRKLDFYFRNGMNYECVFAGSSKANSHCVNSTRELLDDMRSATFARFLKST